MNCRQLEHQAGNHAPDAPSNGLSDRVQRCIAGADRAEQPVNQGDHRIEVGARHSAKHQNQPNESARSGGSILEQLQADVVWREASGHDARPHHSDDEQRRAQGLGGKTACNRDRRGRGLGWLFHCGSFKELRRRLIRSRSSAAVVSKARLVPMATGSLIDQCSQSGCAVISSCA